MLWNALLLPVAWSLHESDRTPVALAVALVAVASIVAAVSTPGRRADGTTPDDEPDTDVTRRRERHGGRDGLS